MVPGTMSSLAVASTVSRSATGSKGLRFVADAAVPPKEHATATTSARIRVVMILLLGHADELTVGRRLLVMAHREASLRCTDWVAIGGIADMPGASRRSGCDATDPSATLVGPKSRSAAGSCRSCGVLSFLLEAREASGSETARVHHGARRRSGVAARGARGRTAPTHRGPLDQF